MLGVRRTDRGGRRIEQQAQILGARHHVAIAAQVEQEDVVREGVERGGELALLGFGDDSAVEADEPSGAADGRARLADPPHADVAKRAPGAPAYARATP